VKVIISRARSAKRFVKDPGKGKEEKEENKQKIMGREKKGSEKN